MKNKMIKYPLLLGVVALVAGLLLAVVYNVTSPIIEMNKNKRENAIVLEMFGDNAKINNVSDTLNNEEKEKGIYAVLEVESGANNYYVYKINTKDVFDGDESSFVVAIGDNGKISKIRFTSVGDSYASSYSSGTYENSIVGKGELSDSDIVSGSTKTGKPIIDSINIAIAHQGRVQ